MLITNNLTYTLDIRAYTDTYTVNVIELDYRILAKYSCVYSMYV